MGVGGLCENIAISSSWAGLGLSLAIKISKNPKNLKNVQKEISGSEEKGDFKCGPAQPNWILTTNVFLKQNFSLHNFSPPMFGCDKKSK